MKRSLLLAAVAALAAAPVQAADVTVAVTDVRAATGRIHVELCPRAIWLGDCPLFGEAPAVAGTTVVTVHGVPAGDYAAQVYHDQDGNGHLKRGLLGIPLEAVGFSRDAAIGRRGPGFEAARFAVVEPLTAIALRLRRLF